MSMAAWVFPVPAYQARASLVPVCQAQEFPALAYQVPVFPVREFQALV